MADEGSRQHPLGGRAREEGIAENRERRRGETEHGPAEERDGRGAATEGPVELPDRPRRRVLVAVVLSRTSVAPAFEADLSNLRTLGLVSIGPAGGLHLRALSSSSAGISLTSIGFLGSSL